MVQPNDLQVGAKNTRERGKRTEMKEKRVIRSWALLVKKCEAGGLLTRSLPVSICLSGWLVWGGVIAYTLQVRRCVYFEWIVTSIVHSRSSCNTHVKLLMKKERINMVQHGQWKNISWNISMVKIFFGKSNYWFCVEEKMIEIRLKRILFRQIGY